jgi:acetyl-CoA carboxylase biotin carboxyl carrier protein
VESKEIQELIELISRSNFKSFELERDDFKLRLVKQDLDAATVERFAATVATPLVVEGQSPALVHASGAAAATGGGASAVPDGLHELKSPIVGTFYSASSPNAPNFVEVGSRVAKGDVLCIVEAMKVMNEIESEIDAEVAEILVSNGQPVEYGEVLYRLKPLAP